MGEQGQLSGQKIGQKYLLGELLGEGGFGAVYKAEHLQVQRQQAIKVLLEKHFRKSDFRERFFREAQTVADLDHPCIIHLDDFWVESSQAYLVMPFISGGTLQDILRKQQGFLKLEQVTAYLENICAALDYAHERGVVHLDLKPLNLLVHEDGRLLLSDFGLAHLMKQGLVEGGASLKFGTPHYMAPEHIQGHPEKQSDGYALGVMLYQMLVGRRPFEGTIPEAVLAQHLTELPTPLRKWRPELPQELEEVLAKALAKEVTQRYQSAGELLVAFKDALAPRSLQLSQSENEQQREGEETAHETTAQLTRTLVQVSKPDATQQQKSLVSPPSGTKTQPALPAQDTVKLPPVRTSLWARHRRTFIVVIAALILLFGGIGGVLTHLPTPARNQFQWHTQLFDASANLHSVVWSGTQFVAVGAGSTIVTSPDGRTWTSQNSPASAGSLIGVAWSGTQFVAVGVNSSSTIGEPQSIGTIVTSPDGRTWTSQVYPTSGGSPDPFWYNLSSVAWSGTQFVAVGATSTATTNGPRSFGTIVTSPDGRTWTSQNFFTSAGSLIGVAWSGTQFVAVGAGGTIVTSPDGRTWHTQFSPTSADLSSVVWSKTEFVAVGAGGTIVTSPDGRTWTSQAYSTLADLFSVVWSGTEFVAVGSGVILILSYSSSRAGPV